MRYSSLKWDLMRQFDISWAETRQCGQLWSTTGAWIKVTNGGGKT